MASDGITYEKEAIQNRIDMQNTSSLAKELAKKFLFTNVKVKQLLEEHKYKINSLKNEINNLKN